MPPRASVRQRAATPARSTRANTNALQDSPAQTRSTRAASKAATNARDVISNPALPQIQIQQSYAYGASKAPALPEQLQAGNLSMKAVANRLDSAREAAEKNLEARAAEARDSTPDSQLSAREARAQRRASREPQTASAQETQAELVRRQDRVQEWVDTSDLEDIQEEQSSANDSDEDPEQQEREDTAPSSFPSGILDHSYSYELGRRAPRTPQAPVQARSPWQARQWLERLSTNVQTASGAISTNIQTATAATGHWFQRMLQSLVSLINSLPDSAFFGMVFKSAVLVSAVAVFALMFCSAYSYICEAGSPSMVSQQLSKLCGRCTNPPKPITFPMSSLNFSSIDPSDLNSLLNALQGTHAQITNLEARLSERIREEHSSAKQEISSLKSHQDALETQIRRISSRQPSSASHATGEIASPLLRKINFFSPSHGAVIDPYLTSPTHQKHVNLPARLGSYLLGINQLKSNPPLTALLPWQDEGDCWCAASTLSPTQIYASVRLGINLPQPIYPTELVIEHLPSTSSLSPGTAPHDLELWADFSHLSYADFERMHIVDLIANSDKSFSPTYTNKHSIGEAWARIATAEYLSTAPVFSASTGEEIASTDNNFDGNGIGANKNHVQRFNLDINQNGLVHHAQRFLVRVKSNYGGEYTCLYRVRLHGRPVKEFESE